MIMVAQENNNIEEQYGLLGMDGWVKMAKAATDRNVLLPATIALSAIALAGCVKPQDLQNLTPEALSRDYAPVKDFLASWGDKLGVGVVYSFFTMARAWQYRTQIWDQKDELEGEVRNIEKAINELQGSAEPEAKRQVKKLRKHSDDTRKLVNPVHSALYIAKEGLEGFLAGSMSTVAAQQAFSPESDIATSTLLIANAAYLNYVALKR